MKFEKNEYVKLLLWKQAAEERFSRLQARECLKRPNLFHKELVCPLCGNKTYPAPAVRETD